MAKKVILITGASSGIGLASALQLLGEGHTVYGAARRIEKMKLIEEKGGTALFMDVSQEESIQSAIDQIIREQGRIDVLFNNAGYGLYGSVEDVTIDQARHQFEVNLFGLARVTQMVLPHMREHKSGTIINTSSMGGKVYTLFGAWYHATKHALEGWSDCLRIELKDFNINVVMVEPGGIQTEWAGIMQQHLMENTGNGPYRPLLDRMLKKMERFGDNSSIGSPVSVISDVVSKIVRSKKPKTRYVAGYGAKMFMRIRKLFGDRVYDKFLLTMST